MKPNSHVIFLDVLGQKVRYHSIGNQSLHALYSYIMYKGWIMDHYDNFNIGVL